MHCKLHKTKDTMILACCDSELAGKTIKHGETKVKLGKNFFGAKNLNEKKLEKLLEKANSINLFGEKCAEVARRKGFIKEQDIIKIGKVPHVQIYKL